MYNSDSLKKISPLHFIKHYSPLYLYINFFLLNDSLIEPPEIFSSSSIKNVNFQNTECWKIEFVNYNDTLNNADDDSIVFYINKADYSLVRQEQYIYYKQVKDYKIKIGDFGKMVPIDDSSIQNDFENLIKSGYYIKPFVENETDEKPIVEKADSFKIAPDFQMTDCNGHKVLLSDIKTRLVLFDFSYLGCAPCCASIPMLNKIHEKYKSKGLSTFWIDPVDYRDTTYALKQFRRLNIQYDVYFDKDKTVVDNYGIIKYPDFFIVELPSRKILYKSKGKLSDVEGELNKVLEEYFSKHR